MTEGRLNRLPYFLYSLALNVGCQIIVGIGMHLQEIGVLLCLLTCIAAIVVHISLAVRRLHDLNRPGSDLWYSLIPFYNIYFGLVLTFVRGTVGPNTYGRDPLLPFFENSQGAAEFGVPAGNQIAGRAFPQNPALGI